MAKVKCPNCDFVNEEGREACAKCGHGLPKVRMAQPKPPPVSSARAEQLRRFQFQPGQLVANRYTVINVIGRGGMGIIYRVRDNVLKEDVALKTLLPQFVRDKVVVERFFNEARIARTLSHPNIIRVHDIGMTGSILFISMELILGRSLRNVLEDMQPGQRLSIRRTLDIMLQLCAALEYAHEHTIHRDIKPENVMISENGVAKLMDFGISKLMSNTRLTGTDVIMGTPFYMSPEQLRDSSAVDARADIYSVGVMLYEVLTGNMPTGVPKPASQVVKNLPPALDPIVAKCVEPDPEARYRSALELRHALEGVRGQVEAAKDFVTSSPEDVEGGRTVRRILGGALVALVLAAGGFGMFSLEKSFRERAAEAPAVAPARPRAPAVPAKEREFDHLMRLLKQARTRAVAAAQDSADWDSLVHEAESLAATLDLKDRSEANIASARRALQYYLAPLIAPEGMVFVPPGEVTVRDGEAADTVNVPGFFIDVAEVTNARYLDFCSRRGWRHPPYDLSGAPDYPVTMVTYYDAQMFAASEILANPALKGAAWAKKRIPTEPQWARAAYGVSELYPWGDEWQPGQFNAGGEEDGFAYSAPVGTFVTDTSRWGCQDMAGNVSEWTCTPYGPLPYKGEEARSGEANLDFGKAVVLRGGNFRGDPATPLNMRWSNTYETVADCLGFRCVLELPENLDDIEAFLASL